MPKIKLKEKIEQQIEEAKRPVLEQGPKVITYLADESDETKKTAKSIFNKMFSIEKEEVTPEENKSQVELVYTKRNIGQTFFKSDGKSKIVSVYPSNHTIKYSLELLDKNGNVISTIPNLRKIYRAKIDLMAGNYILRVNSERGGRLPFMIKIE